MVNLMMNAHIYIVTNEVNQKQYVGQTTVARNKVGHGMAMTEAYAVYGKKNFSYNRICSDISNRNTLNCLEKFWIAVCGTVAPNGYNIELGGSDKGEVSQSTRQKMSALFKGRPMKEETKKKISASMQGSDNHFYGKTHTQEALEKIGKASIGREKTLSEETKQYLSSIRQGELNPFYGKKHSDETKAKFVGRTPNKHWLGKKFSDEHKAHLSMERTCPHCGKIGKGNAMIRHHMNNCKFAEELA